MVCVPCILLPFLLALYIKFIQPLIIRLLPESWQAWFNSVFYPTCPARPPKPTTTTDKHAPTAPPPNATVDGDDTRNSGSGGGTNAGAGKISSTLLSAQSNSSSTSSLHTSDDFEHVSSEDSGDGGVCCGEKVKDKTA